MQRLFILVCRALRFNEPVLLVGETGSGKTSVCQVYADAVKQMLIVLNCHQNTETANLIGGLRPVRNKSVAEAEAIKEVSKLLESFGLGVGEVGFDELTATWTRHSNRLTWTKR
jgi:midasin